MLDDIGFIWNVQDYIWTKNFELLLEFRKKNKNKWPSQRSKEKVEHKLAVWFLGIRKDYKKNKLAPDRIASLEEIGFPFFPREYRWEQTFQSVEKWIAKHGDFPKRGSKNQQEIKLFNWCRYQAIKKEYGVLDDEQIELLNNLNIAHFVKDLKDFEKARAEAKKQAYISSS